MSNGGIGIFDRIGGVGGKESPGRNASWSSKFRSQWKIFVCSSMKGGTEGWSEWFGRSMITVEVVFFLFTGSHACGSALAWLKESADVNKSDRALAMT